MDKKLKTKWVKALTSGRYKQGNSMLYDNDGTFCCLGVLGRVMGVPASNMQGCGFPDHMDNAPEHYANALPRRVQNKLAELNDADVPFDMIAGLIDQAL